MEMIMAFLVANSGVLIITGLLIFGGIVAFIARDRQKAFTRLYGLCVEAESLELSKPERFTWVLDKGYNCLPLAIKALVSEDSIKHAIEFAFTNLKKFSALRMGVAPETVVVEQAKEITEAQKIISEVKKVELEGKEEISKIVEDVKTVIEKVSPKEILATLSSAESFRGCYKW